MRVLHLACLAPPEVGGIGMSALREVEELRARGHEAVLVAPQMRGGERGDRPVGVRAQKALWRVGNAAQLPLKGLLRESWDVIHLHYPFYGTAEPLLALPRNIPIVMTFHMDGVMGGWREPIAHLHRWCIQPWLLRRVKQIFVSSLDYALASSLQTLVKRKDPRIIELPFGIDLSLFQPGPAERSRFSLPEDKKVLLMVGGLDRPHLFKGVPVALRALKAMHSEDVILAIRGDGALQPTFALMAKELGIADRVRFLPPCNREALAALYRSADVLLFPSTSRSEAFGLVAIEAQACGTPVIASDLPGVRSVVVPGQTGWLVPPGDADALARQVMYVLHRTPEEIARHALQATQNARKRYDQITHMDRLIESYQRVCALQS